MLNEISQSSYSLQIASFIQNLLLKEYQSIFWKVHRGFVSLVYHKSIKACTLHTHFYAINLHSKKEKTHNFPLHFITVIIISMQTQGSVDENVMLVRLHVRIRNTSVISWDFFLMVLTLVCLFECLKEKNNLYPYSKALYSYFMRKRCLDHI